MMGQQSSVMRVKTEVQKLRLTDFIGYLHGSILYSVEGYQYKISDPTFFVSSLGLFIEH